MSCFHKYGYHVVPPPYTGTGHTTFNVELSPTKLDKDLSHTHRPSAPIIKDWVSDSEDDSEVEIPQNTPSFVQTTEQVKPPRPVTAVVPKTRVTRPRPAKSVVTKPHSPPRRHINRSQSSKPSNFSLKVTAAKAPMGNPQHALKDKRVIDSGCSRHMTGNMSYLSDFKKINGGYFAFGGNLKGGKISGKGKIMTGKLDFDDVYFVKELKFNLFSVSQMCDKKNSVFLQTLNNRVLVTKPQNKTHYELLLRQTPSIGFMRHFGCPVTILNTLDPLGKFDGKADEGFLVGYSNTNDDAAFGGKKHEFEEEKPESEVHVSPSSSAQTKKHDDKTKKKAKGKSPVELSTGYRNLSAEFEDFFDNNINKDNADDSQVYADGNSSYMDTSQYPDDLNMPKLEDITYSDDEKDAGAEADFTNLETTITVSHIPTTRVHKDHPVTQIISDLSSATQTRSMTRVVKYQGGLTQINNEDFHTCMFACFLSQEEPKRVHQALKDPSWIEA
nr:hypothetical protein [Tanacetum cinerariifolium]